MPKYSRGVMRLLGVLALAVVLSPTVYTVASGSAGRNFSRCIQACNDTRRACGDACDANCLALFPSNKPARDACKAACKADCDVVSDDCKLQCQEDRDNSPTEP